MYLRTLRHCINYRIFSVKGIRTHCFQNAGQMPFCSTRAICVILTYSKLCSQQQFLLYVSARDSPLKYNFQPKWNCFTLSQCECHSLTRLITRPVTDVLNTQGKMRVQQQNIKEKHEGNYLDKIYVCADSIMRK